MYIYITYSIDKEKKAEAARRGVAEMQREHMQSERKSREENIYFAPRGKEIIECCCREAEFYSYFAYSALALQLARCLFNFELLEFDLAYNVKYLPRVCLEIERRIYARCTRDNRVLNFI